MSLFLSLFIFSCSRDETFYDTNPLTAKHIFLEHYYKSGNLFCKFVVERLLDMNDSTYVIDELVNNYGQPLWDLALTPPVNRGVIMLVPIKALTANQFRAIALFASTDSAVTMTVFRKRIVYSQLQEPEALFRYFESLLSPEICNSTLHTFTIRELPDPKTMFYPVEFCWVSLASSNGGLTWELTNESCYTIGWNYEGSTVINDGGYTGNGGSADSGGGGSGTSPNTTALSPPASKNLEIAKLSLEKGPCFARTVLSSTWNSRITITLNDDISPLARYNSLTGKLEFRDEGAIKDFVLLHELMHVLQGNLYGTTYTHTQTHEFESWLEQDMYLISMGRDEDNLTWSKKLGKQIRQDYYIWAKSIVLNGFTSGIDGNIGMCTFWRDLFISTVPEYGKLPKGNGAFPGTLNNILTNCKN